MKKQILLFLATLLASEWLVAQKFQGGSFDGSAGVTSGVITLVGSPTSYAYTNPRFFGGSFDGSASVASGVITLVGSPTSYAYTNPRFFGGSFDGSASVASGVITLVGTPTSYAYTNPRFFGGSFDGFSSIISDTLTLNGESAAFVYSNPRFFGGSFSGTSTIRGDSVFTLDVEEKTPSVRIPKDYALAQNYPNPFNPTTIIQYDLPTASQVCLELFDVLGRKVATLINAKQSVGTHAYTLRASAFALASGVYFYRLQAGEYVQTRKMVLIK